MRIFDEQDHELQKIDESKGYLIPDRLFIAHHEAVEAVQEVGHWKTIAEYPNGGKDVEWVVDTQAVEAKDAWDEYEDILRYRLFSQQEQNAMQINLLKQNLSDTDYITAKAIDLAVEASTLTELLSAFSTIHAQYKETFAQRALWRARINELEKQ